MFEGNTRSVSKRNTKFLVVHSNSHRRSVIEANEVVAYPVFGHAVEL